MDTTTMPAPPAPVPAPPRREVDALLTLIEARTAEENRYLLEQLLRQVLGDPPPRETGIYNPDKTPYVYILEPEHRIRLFVTPERVALWNAQDPAKSRTFSEMVALLQRRDEEEIRKYIQERNA